MSPPIVPPSPDELARIMDEHAHRFPETASIKVPGDGDVLVKLPLLLGIPTGALPVDKDGKTLTGTPVSSAWSNAVAARLKFRADDDATGGRLVADCVLWPSPSMWREWCAEWAAIDGAASRLVALKIGSYLDVIQEPADGEKPPAGIAPSARGVWRVLTPQGKRFDVAIEPPDSTAWRLFVKAALAPGEDVARRAREIVEASVTGFAPGTLLDALDRYPGLVMALLAQSAYLAGVGAEVTLGEW